MKTAKATVTLTMEVCADGSWGGECSIAQADKQAKESAISRVRELLANKSGVRLVGEAKVSIVLVDSP
jgi:hypothetical protein